MGRKRKGSVIGDLGKMWLNTIASPFEALTGQNFVDFKYTSDFGKGASKVVEPLTKGISGAMMAMGTTALNAVAPGAGTALSGMGQGIGQGMKQNSIQQPPMQMSNKTRPTPGINSVPYGVQEGMPKTGYRHGGMLKSYNAPTHENGGQMIDANANPTNNPNKAVGEIEKKETSWNGYVFSDTLGEGKKTFAQMSKEIVNRYKGKRDNLSKKTMEKELLLLIQKNEAARLEKEQMEMQQQQQQNPFTEEQLAALQNPEGGRRAKAEIFGDERYQQQGQPSEEEMMMMQQMQQQQGGMPQEGMPQDMGQYRWGGNMDVPMYQYQNGGMLEVPEAPLDEYKKGGWIQKATKSIKKRGTEGVCTGDKFGGPSCPPGSKRYNLAKTFKAMAKKEDGGYIDSLPDISLAKYPDGGEIQEPPGFFERMLNGMQVGLDLAQFTPLAPEAYLVSLPLTTYDVAKDLYRGDYAQAGADALGYIPTVRGRRAVGNLGKQAVKEYKTVNRTVNAANLANDVQKTYSDNAEENNENRTATQKVKNMKSAASPEKTYYGGELPEVTVRPKKEYKDGGMIKRADGSYSKRGLWDNIRDNIGSGKKPTKEMLEQEAKIKAQEYRDGGYVVTRSNDRKGKTHKVTGPDGSVKYFGDPDLKNNPSEKARDAFYARHKKNLEGNPHFRAYARATWRDGGMIPEYADGGFPPIYSNTPSLREISEIGQQLETVSPYTQMLNNAITGAAQKPYTAYENQGAPFTASTENPFDVNTHYSNVPIPNPYYRKKAMDVLGLGNLGAEINKYVLPQYQEPLKYQEPLQASSEVYLRENMPGGMRDVSELPAGSITPYLQTSVPLGNEIPSNTAPEAIIQRHPFELQMEEAARNPIPPVALNPYANQTPPPTTPEEDPFKLRPLEYATIGLKGAALGKSIYDALQPAEKEQLRLNREAGLVNNMMAGRNVNMAAALNEALYNRNAALASNQARSANVQRALDMQTYSNTERNAIRSKLEEQNMNNQLRMQEAQVRAELGASEAAERVRRQNVQSMNEAARRAFGQKAFQDLSTIGTELNKAQVYKDMYKDQRAIAERQYNEYMNFLQQSGGRYTVANLSFSDYLQGKIPQIVVNTNYQQPQQEPKKEEPKKD